MVTPRATSVQNADVELTLRPEDHPPLFANLLTVQMNSEEFLITLAFIHPEGGRPMKGSVLGRYVVSPAHAKRIVQILAEEVARHEALFGPITKEEDLNQFIERSH
jgi:hypothetical protein